MSVRAEQLQIAADEQIAGLIELVSSVDEEDLRRPCPGREKLGDGSIAAIAAHTAVNYQRIGAFVATSQSMFSRHGNGQPPQHRIPRFVRALGHPPPTHNQAGAHRHQDGFTSETARQCEIVERLTTARGDLVRIAALTDQRLDRVPPKDSFRFCDGERTLEQVLMGLLRHQDHQVRALRAALARTP